MNLYVNNVNGDRADFGGVSTHFSPMSHFYTPWKSQKTYGFPKYSGGIEMGH